MEFTEHLKASEKFLSGKFHYSPNDDGENALRTTVESFISASNDLDQYKKLKYYGKPLSPELAKKVHQMTVQGFERSEDGGMEKLLHAALGLATESGELLEAVYKAKWAGEKFDVVNCKEELGDLFWYMAILFREFGFTLEDVLQINNDKLDKRYGAKFTENAAIHRDLQAERNILEGKSEV